MPSGRLASMQREFGKSGGGGGGQWMAWRQAAGGRKPPDVSDTYTYDLYAVCNHHGGMNGGHYTGKHGV